MSRVEPNRNVYVGHRYVPKIMGEWDNQNEYEGLSIVTHQGTSFTSKKRVPVGIDIKNEEFWVVTGNYNAQVEYYRQDVVDVVNDVEDVRNELNLKSDQSYVENNYKMKNENIGFYIEDFWEEQDTDWSNAFNRANAELKEGQTIILEAGKHYLITETIVFDKLINIKGNNATLQYLGNGKALQYGVENENMPARNEYGLYTRWEDFTLTNSQDVDYALLGGDTTSIGLELVNIIQCEFSNILVHNFHTNIILKGINGKGCQTNRFYNLRSVDGLINIKFIAENNGWVNENTFFGGHFTSSAPNDTGLTDQAIVISMTDTDNHRFNHNHFHNINLENRWSSKVLECNGTDNTFNNLRWEGTKTRAIIFGEDSQKNIIFGGFGFGGLDGGKVLDNGNGNTLIPGYGRTLFNGGNSFGVVQGINRTLSENGGKARYPVFSTMHKDDPNNLSVALGHEGIAMFRKDRVDNPGIWIDSENSQLKIGNGNYPIENLPYFSSNSQRHIEVNNTFDEVAFKIGDDTKPAFLMLGNKYLWLDDSNNLRVSNAFPSDINTSGSIIGSPN